MFVPNDKVSRAPQEAGSGNAVVVVAVGIVVAEVVVTFGSGVVNSFR